MSRAQCARRPRSSIPHRHVQCRICSWNAYRTYSGRGILCAPCPKCGGPVQYAAVSKGDPPVTTDRKIACAGAVVNARELVSA